MRRVDKSFSAAWEVRIGEDVSATRKKMKLSTQCVFALVLVIAVLVEARGTGSLNFFLHDDFVFPLYKELAKNRDSKNIFFSPLSIRVILALVYVGAGGKTAEQMAYGLQLPRNMDYLIPKFQSILGRLATDNDSENVTLQLANKIYLAKDLEIKDSFNEVAKKIFYSQVTDIDFTSNAKAAKIINAWVEKKTHKKIRRIVSKHDLHDDTMAVLVNALYFKGYWEQKFEKYVTTSVPFHVTARKTKNVEMMHNKIYAGFMKSEELGADILELPYQGNTISFVVILPSKINGLAAVENKLIQSPGLLSFSFNSLIGQNVKVCLPKFKLQESFNLKDQLKALGMTEMFKKSANFSGISETPIAVSQVLHKAFIKVNEEGTSAAAATAVLTTDLISIVIEPEPPTFIADHPFLFFIRSRTTGAIIFMGRYADPK